MGTSKFLPKLNSNDFSSVFVPAKRARPCSLLHHPPRLISDYLAGKKVSEQEFRQPHHNHLTSINSEIDRPNDGNVLVAQELSDALQAKIRWGILTPWRIGVPFWLAYPCDVWKFWVHFGPHRWDAAIHLQHTIALVYARYELWPWLPPRQSIPFGSERLRGATRRRRPGALYPIWLRN